MAKKVITKESRLAILESQIETGVVAIRVALLAIHEEDLYGDSFETYCKSRWGFSASQGYRILDEARAERNVSPIGDTSKLKGSHLQAISKSPEDRQAEIAASVMAKAEAEGRQPTERDFAKAVKAAIAQTSDDPPPAETGATSDDDFTGCFEAAIACPCPESDPFDDEGEYEDVEDEPEPPKPEPPKPKPGSTPPNPVALATQAIKTIGPMIKMIDAVGMAMGGRDGKNYKRAEKGLREVLEALTEMRDGNK